MSLAIRRDFLPNRNQKTAKEGVNGACFKKDETIGRN